MTKTVSILQSNYIPWKGYFDIIAKSDVFIFYDSVQFTKNDWRNRNRIKTRNGVEWITIPVRNESLHQKINETNISFKDWNKKHWKTIRNNYSRAKCFKTLEPFFEDLYLNQLQDVSLLSEVNYKLIVAISKLLKFETTFLWDKDLGLIEGKTERLVDLCKKTGANVYLSGPAAKDYLQEDMFKDSGMEVQWMDYSGYPEYEQLYPPFEHGVSILDLLFNTGEGATEYMKSGKLKCND